MVTGIFKIGGFRAPTHLFASRDDGIYSHRINQCPALSEYIAPCKLLKIGFWHLAITAIRSTGVERCLGSEKWKTRWREGVSRLNGGFFYRLYILSPYCNPILHNSKCTSDC